MMTDKQWDDVLAKLFADIRFGEEPAGLYEPLRYMIDIGGKRIRPRLCLLAYALYRDGLEPGTLEPGILNCAAALEVFHSFTLIHDDIMDRSPLRRGQQTVWRKWGEVTAILSGDVMLIDAYRRMAAAPAAVREEVMALFSRTAAQVCEGQQYDMEFEAQPEVDAAAYDRMIGLKTAVLLACSAKVGALCAGAPSADCEALYRYGYHLGMAFQVADDYLDTYGDEKVFGKPIGGDILNGKKSWLTVHTVLKSDDAGAALRRALGQEAATPEQKAAKIASVRALYDALGIPEDALAEIRRHTDLALSALAETGLGAVRRELLHRFADKLVGRVK